MWVCLCSVQRTKKPARLRLSILTIFDPGNKVQLTNYNSNELPTAKTQIKCGVDRPINICSAEIERQLTHVTMSRTQQYLRLLIGYTGLFK